ncbi:hypothetical protein [Streptomyces hilarionis]|nr:hypothetical protein [Streptomyces hilarionis]
MIRRNASALAVAASRRSSSQVGSALAAGRSVVRLTVSPWRPKE